MAWLKMTLAKICSKRHNHEHWDFWISRIIGDDPRFLDPVLLHMTPALLIRSMTTFDDIQRPKNYQNGNLSKKSSPLPREPDLTIDSSFLVCAHLPPFDRSFNLHMLQTLEAISHFQIQNFEIHFSVWWLAAHCSSAAATDCLTNLFGAGADYWVIDHQAIGHWPVYWPGYWVIDRDTRTIFGVVLWLFWNFLNLISI